MQLHTNGHNGRIDLRSVRKKAYFLDLSRETSFSLGIMTQAEEATKNAIPIIRFVLIVSFSTHAATAVARIGLTRKVKDASVAEVYSVILVVSSRPMPAQNTPT